VGIVSAAAACDSGTSADAAPGPVIDGAPGHIDSAVPAPDANGTGDASPMPAQVTRASASISARSGGTLAIDGASVSFPAGALASDTTFTLELASAKLPAPIASTSRVYTLTPSVSFDAPVSFTLTGVAGRPSLEPWLEPPAACAGRRGIYACDGPGCSHARLQASRCSGTTVSGTLRGSGNFGAGE
jgi:hypothetical protein